jgi:hypothetical protein
MSSYVSVRERWLATSLLGLGLITFAIDASNSQLILPQIMTSLRVEVYQIHTVSSQGTVAFRRQRNVRLPCQGNSFSCCRGTK